MFASASVPVVGAPLYVGASHASHTPVLVRPGVRGPRRASFEHLSLLMREKISEVSGHIQEEKSSQWIVLLSWLCWRVFAQFSRSSSVTPIPVAQGEAPLATCSEIKL